MNVSQTCTQQSVGLEPATTHTFWAEMDTVVWVCDKKLEHKFLEAMCGNPQPPADEERSDIGCVVVMENVCSRW